MNGRNRTAVRDDPLLKKKKKENKQQNFLHQIKNRLRKVERKKKKRKENFKFFVVFFHLFFRRIYLLKFCRGKCSQITIQKTIKCQSIDRTFCAQRKKNSDFETISYSKKSPLFTGDEQKLFKKKNKNKIWKAISHECRARELIFIFFFGRHKIGKDEKEKKIEEKRKTR